MRSQGTWQRGGLALLFLLTLLLAPSAATFAQATGATDPDEGTVDATATTVSCSRWEGTYGTSLETRTG